MKKILIALITILLLSACSTKNVENESENAVIEPVEEITEIEEEATTGGWLINGDLPEMNDADFNTAREKLLGVNYSSLFILGTQASANNTKYLCYATAVTPTASTEFKVVTVHKDYDDPTNCEIIEVEDFKILNYLLGEGANTPDGLMGGWQDNIELPNMLSDEDKAVFEKAFEGFVGVGYTPVAKLATQVVSGTNYAFLSLGTTVTANPVTHLYIVKISSDLNGNTNIENICGVDLSEILK